jgi:hypothetical protein
MGHQVTFYATRPDIDRLEAAFRIALEISIVHSRNSIDAARVVRSTTLDPTWLFYDFSRPIDVPLIKMEHVPTQGYWTVDVLRSPVVEFSACYFDGKVLRAGRSYYVDGYYDDRGSWTEKSPEFRAWGKSLLSMLKKALTKRGSSYVGLDALRWLESSGGTLEG